MAIDTREKRQSAGGVPFLPNGPNVTPNASKDVEWRQQSAWSYSGIAPGAPVAIVVRLSRGLYEWTRGLYHGEYVPNS